MRCIFIIFVMIATQVIHAQDRIRYIFPDSIEKELIKNNYEDQIKNKNLKVLKYDDVHKIFELQCKKCNYKWKTNLSKLEINGNCPMCNLEEIMKNFRR